jgi:hypothetical protein
MQFIEEGNLVSSFLEEVHAAAFQEPLEVLVGAYLAPYELVQGRPFL